MAKETLFHQLQGTHVSSPVAVKISDSLEALAGRSGRELTLRDMRVLNEENPHIPEDTVIGVDSRYADPTGLTFTAAWLNEAGREIAYDSLGAGAVKGQITFEGQNDAGEFVGSIMPAIIDSAAKQRQTVEVRFVADIEEDATIDGDFALYGQASRVGLTRLLTTSSEPGNRGIQHIFTGRAPEALGRDIAWALGSLQDSDPRPINP